MREAKRRLEIILAEISKGKKKSKKARK